ncbi:MAG: ATP-binding protein [Proteobacteria bacterium]|nr:ATP-binding protein [Pseudomonadota bacterium]
MPLVTYAEKQADAARNIDGFKDFALDGVRDKVTMILNMIGRVDGVFSTYTLHDISHVDAMLNMLEWLVPPETREKLTPVEWLLIVLSFYFHDLGMVVTHDEFRTKEEDPLFRTFAESLNNDPNSRDYMDRLQNIPEQERDAFLYQEFIRANHAHRIREWVTGEHDRTWGEHLDPVANEITSILHTLPTRFRRNLADICESHHKDNLEDRSYFPLCQRYGPPEAVANTQYIALLLRTTDLLHITKDRTPSIMFRTLNISDLMGVEEWKKQMGTFTVSMKTREFHPSEADTHLVVVSADFDEERPFFVLTEYIAYANQQIEQNHRWASKSQQEADAKHYWFPWYRVEGDIRVEGNEPRPMRFELDRGRLLNLLVGHTIYNDPTVAVRELLQNAIDSVRYQYYLDDRDARSESLPLQMGRVSVKWHDGKRQLIVQDQGVGMDLDIIKHHLMTVGASFYDSPAFKVDSADFIPISRFGIGILTCFMVSDNVEIRTWKNGQGHRIRMSSVQADYLIKELRDGDRITGEDDEHGTTVSLILRPSVDLSERSILDILKHWVVLPACEVLYEETGKPPEKIGFSSPSDALRYFLFEAENDEASEIDPAVIDIERQDLSLDGAHYELAFAVKRGFTPERNFVNKRPKKAPGTCLEGIRVDAALPGFLETAAILSVRNNRAFRTTVSRDELERDDEYFRVAELCANMFHRHVSNEVTRIQDGKGHPLSQASTAARWLVQMLQGIAAAPIIVQSVQRFYRSLPHIILETHSNTSSPSSPARQMVSLDDVSSKEFFWTIDARVVDYLGVISRDLGRELSFGEFLSGIAPELLDPSMSPVISDAHHYKEHILGTHCCEVVKFSKRHQQTVVKWIRRTEPPQVITLNKMEHEAIRQRMDVIGEVSRYLIHRGESDVFNTFIHDDLLVAEIQGDIKKVSAVKTRLAVILSPGSEYAEPWSRLRSAIFDLHGHVSLPEFATLWILGMVFHDALTHSGEWLSFSDISPLQFLWKDLMMDIEAIAPFQSLEIELPLDIRKLQTSENRFDATRYWLDWDR